MVDQSPDYVESHVPNNNGVKDGTVGMLLIALWDIAHKARALANEEDPAKMPRVREELRNALAAVDLDNPPNLPQR